MTTLITLILMIVAGRMLSARKGRIRAQSAGFFSRAMGSRDSEYTFVVKHDGSLDFCSDLEQMDGSLKI